MSAKTEFQIVCAAAIVVMSMTLQILWHLPIPQTNVPRENSPKGYEFKSVTKPVPKTVTEKPGEGPGLRFPFSLPEGERRKPKP